VRFAGRDLLRLPEAEMRAVRGGGMAMIFQEPATSLNPVLTVGRQIGEVLERHLGLRGAGGARAFARTADGRSASPIRNGGSANIPSSFPAA
jgi:ABC-type microcin C transport system duplicated ATPase subunit YejF